MSLTQATRALLAATASLPGAVPLATVRAVMDARRLVEEALEMAAKEGPPRLVRAKVAPGANVDAWRREAAGGGHFWPRVREVWQGPGNLSASLYLLGSVGPANCFPLPGSIATRTKCSPPVASLMGWWTVRRGATYLGHVSLYRGDSLEGPPPAGKVRKVVERAWDRRSPAGVV